MSEQKGASMKNTVKALALMGILCGVLQGCSDADIASANLSKAADQFELERRIVFYNGITDQYILTIEGKCSLRDAQRQLEVTCKIGPDEYKKHFLGLSDNVTYFSEQIGTADVGIFHYRVIFKPQAIVPYVDVEGGNPFEDEDS